MLEQTKGTEKTMLLIVGHTHRRYTATLCPSQRFGTALRDGGYCRYWPLCSLALHRCCYSGLKRERYCCDLRDNKLTDVLLKLRCILRWSHLRVHSCSRFLIAPDLQHHNVVPPERCRCSSILPSSASSCKPSIYAKHDSSQCQ